MSYHAAETNTTDTMLRACLFRRKRKGVERKNIGLSGWKENKKDKK